MNVATLTAKMVMDASGFMTGTKTVTRGLNDLKQGASIASGGFGSLFASVTAGSLAAAASMKVLSLATRGIGTAFGEIGRGFKLAAQAETAESGFKVMLGSAEKAKLLMKDLATFTMATPFSTEGTLAVTESLLGVGVAQERLLPTMKMLGEISGGNVEKLKGLAVVYGQVQSKGKLLTQDFNQIAERGINMRDVLAKEVGVGVKDLAKTMEAGKITFVDFHNALQTLSTTKYKGFMDEKGKTMQGAMDRIGEIRDSFARDVAMGIGKEFGITGTAGDFANFAEGLSAKVLPEFVGGIVTATNELFVLSDNLRGLGAIIRHITFADSGVSPISSAIGVGADLVAGRNPFGISEALGGIDSRRDVRKVIEDIKRAGDEATKNKAALQGAQRMENSTFTDLGKAIGSGLAADFSKAFIGVGGVFGGVGMEGARDLTRKFFSPDERPEQRPTGALVAGSSEAFSAIIAAMTGRDKNTDAKRTAKATEAAVKKLDEAVKFLERIAKEAGGDVVNAFAG